jgi:hypothetical protein
MGYSILASFSRFLISLAFFTVPTAIVAQTPSPLQEWQYSSGLILARVFQPELPEFRVISGVGSAIQPIYDGSRAYRVLGGPVINVQFKALSSVRVTVLAITWYTNAVCNWASALLMILAARNATTTPI